MHNVDETGCTRHFLLAAGAILARRKMTIPPISNEEDSTELPPDTGEVAAAAADLPSDAGPDGPHDEEYLEEEYDTEPRIHVPRFVIWSGLGILTLACFILTVQGFSEGSWSYGPDPLVHLSACLTPLRIALASSGAPKDVTNLLTRAAQPQIRNSDALESLWQVEKRLASIKDNPVTVEVADEIRGLLAEGNRGYLMCGYRPNRPISILPTPTRLP